MQITKLLRPAVYLSLATALILITKAILFVDKAPDMIDLTSNCVAWYKCNDNKASTLVLDSRGYAHGTAQRNTSLMHTTGKIGGALSFNGSSDYIDTGKTFQSVFQDSFSISFWFKADDGQPPSIEDPLGTDNDLALAPEDMSASFRLFTNGRFSAIYGQGDVYLLANFSDYLQNGSSSWIHAVMVVTKISESQARIDLYRDSVIQSHALDVRIADINMSLFANLHHLFIGANTDHDGEPLRFFSGSCDNIMIFNKALSQDEIDFLYNDGDGTERLAEGDLCRVYCGQDGNIDYETVIAEMELSDTKVVIEDQDLPANTIWHYVRRRVAGDGCEKESPDSPVCIVRIDASGDMLGQTPNAPVNLTAEGLADAKVKLQWRYPKLAEEIAPTGFHIYIDSGSGFDFENPDATGAYRGGGPKAGEFDWTSGELVNGEIYKFCVRSYREGISESQNTNYVSITADSEGPEAIIDLMITAEEL